MHQFPAPGDRIGRFQVLSQLGQGGMGVVYTALEVNLDRRVALKVISPLFADDPAFRQRFTSEARALASLDSPHVVQVYAHGEEDGYLYIAAQLIPDGDLGQMITRWGPAPLGKALEVIDQVSHGLADAHAAGLVHRDIKPANVLVRRRGDTMVQAYLGDFGIARRVDHEVTRLGSMVVGTPSYMAPELHAGTAASVATDIYSLGCVLWVTLTGQPPYGGTTEFEIVNGHVSKPVPQLPGVSPLVEAVNRILRVSMAKEPGHRYRTAQALRDDVREAMRMTGDLNHGRLASDLTSPSTVQVASPAPSPMPTPAPTPPPYTPVGPPTPTPALPQYLTVPPATRRSRKGLSLVVAGAVAAVAIGGGAALLADRGGDDPADPAIQAFTEQSAEEILREAEKEMRVLDSVRITGTVVTDGVEAGVDLVITSAGNCDGTLSQGGGSADVRRIDGTAWLRPDEAFLKASGGSDVEVQAYVTFIGDKWVQADAEQATELDSVCDLDELLEGDDSESTVTKGAVSDRDGTQVVEVTEVTDSGATKVFVKTGEPHYVLALDGGDDLGRFSFSDFDAPFTAQAPPADEVIDVSSFTS